MNIYSIIFFLLFLSCSSQAAEDGDRKKPLLTPSRQISLEIEGGGNRHREERRHSVSYVDHRMRDFMPKIVSRQRSDEILRGASSIHGERIIRDVDEGRRESAAVPGSSIRPDVLDPDSRRLGFVRLGLEEQSIRDRDRDIIFSWIEDEVITTQQGNCKTNSILRFSIISGAGRGVIYFKLGYDLIGRISKLPHVATIFFSSLYGTGVFIPMLMLGSKTTNSNVQLLFKESSTHEKRILREIPCAEQSFEMFFQTIAFLGGVFTAPTLTYLTYDDLHKPIGYAWILPGIPTFYVRTLIDYYCITRLVKETYWEIRDYLDANNFYSYDVGTPGYLLREVRKKLKESRNFIDSFTPAQARRFFKAYEEKSNLEKINLILNPRLFLREEVNEIQTDIIKEAFGIVGLIIGIYGVWVYYPVAVDSFVPIFDFLSLNVSKKTLYGVGGFATAASSALTAISSRSSFMKTYDAITNTFSVISNFIGSAFSYCGCCGTRRELAQQGEEELVLSDDGSSSEAYLLTDDFRDRDHRRRHSGVEAYANGNPENDDAIAEREQANFIKNRIIAGTFATILGICYAGTQVDIALQFLNINNTWAKIELSAAVISQFSSAFWSVDEVLLEYLTSTDPKTSLTNKIDKITSSTSKMSPRGLKGLLMLFERRIEPTTIN
jgi:hypothetical protein